MEIQEPNVAANISNDNSKKDKKLARTSEAREKSDRASQSREAQSRTLEQRMAEYEKYAPNSDAGQIYINAPEALGKDWMVHYEALQVQGKSVPGIENRLYNREWEPVTEAEARLLKSAGTEIGGLKLFKRHRFFVEKDREKSAKIEKQQIYGLQKAALSNERDGTLKRVIANSSTKLYQGT